jgi:hypothetical protein
MASWHPPKLGFRPRSLTPQALTRQPTPPGLSALGDLPAPSDLEKAERVGSEGRVGGDVGRLVAIGDDIVALDPPVELDAPLLGKGKGAKDDVKDLARHRNGSRLSFPNLDCDPHLLHSAPPLTSGAAA